MSPKTDDNSEPSSGDKREFDPDTVATLKEVAEWWREKQQRPDRPEEMRFRPEFVGKRANSSFRINEKLLKRALSKAKTPQEKARTGGKLSGLVEWLLWEYLGYPDDVLKKDDSE